ncbi:MAG TPA: hypothetical protein DEA08_26870 [Planctomycetes bacterium]|nr:hypothetical protein [Planctomycetota bacterium]
MLARTLLALLVSTCLLAEAKPMAAPTLEQALRAPLIVVAEFNRHDDEAKPSYFGGVPTWWYVDEVWKAPKEGGPRCGAKREVVSVSWAFSDGSACIEPKDWTFDEERLAKSGQRYLLFLTPAGKGYRTYRGSYGRWPLAKLTKPERAQLQALLGKPLAGCPKCETKTPPERTLRGHPQGMTWSARCRACSHQWRDLEFGFEKKKATK